MFEHITIKDMLNFVKRSDEQLYKNLYIWMVETNDAINRHGAALQDLNFTEDTENKTYSDHFKLIDVYNASLDGLTVAELAQQPRKYSKNPVLRCRIEAAKKMRDYCNANQLPEPEKVAIILQSPPVFKYGVDLDSYGNCYKTIQYS